MAHLNDHFSFFKYKLVQSKECFPKGEILGERFFGSMVMGQELWCKQCSLDCLVYLFRLGCSKYLSKPSATVLPSVHTQGYWSGLPFPPPDLQERGSHLKVQKCLVHTASNKIKLWGKCFTFCPVISPVLGIPYFLSPWPLCRKLPTHFCHLVFANQASLKQ